MRINIHVLKFILAFSFFNCIQNVIGQVKESNKDVLIDLLEGNTRFVKEQYQDHSNLKEKIMRLSKAQNPKAIVISCSDSRVPPEIIFDQNLGDLFVVRVAGNVASDAVIGSIEYAVRHLGVGLIIVLGHERCGAVRATIEKNRDTDHITLITDYIGTELERAKKMQGDLVDNTVRVNITKTVGIIKRNIDSHNDILEKSFIKGNLRIVGAYYDLDTGVIEITDK